MNKKEELKYKWSELYSYIIPTVITIAYFIYFVLKLKGKITTSLIQDSNNFDEMLKTLVTFMSIILSVFGFLIPSFLGSKGESEAINYFLKYADMKLFATKLKNVVAFGLIDIFLSSILLLADIMPDMFLNVLIIIWLWFLFFFMCSSYRFISLMINLLLTTKKKSVQEAGNKVSDEVIKDIHNNISSI